MTTALRGGLAVIVVAAGAGIAGYYASLPTNPTPAQSRDFGASPNAAKRMPPITLPDLDGRDQPLAQWQGKVLVVNFWATWCPPCLEEIPEFSRISRQYAAKGVQFVGISTDPEEKVRAFTSGTEIPYPTLLGGFDILDLVADLGNPTKGLPFTIVLRRDGNVNSVKVGRLAGPDLEKALIAALEQS